VIARPNPKINAPLYGKTPQENGRIVRKIVLSKKRGRESFSREEIQ
jgi:hypothetical protein